MPICIECQHPVKTLWTKYNTGGGAGAGASSGHNIRLTVCKNCGRFCDKYVEHDFVVIFIDLVLIKPQVYRHLLHNTLMKEKDQFDPSMIRLGILLLLFDVYLTWARIEKQSIPSFSDPASLPRQHESNLGKLDKQPIGFQYMFFLVLCTLTTLAFHLSIRFLTSSSWSPLVLLGLLPTSSWFDAQADANAPNVSNTGGSIATGVNNPSNSATILGQQPQQQQPEKTNSSDSFSQTDTAAPSSQPPSSSSSSFSSFSSSPQNTQLILPSPNAVSTALLVSSSTKLFPILMVIWDYDVPAAARSLGWAVVANNVEALKILLDCSYPIACILATAGAAARWAAGYIILRIVGLEGVESTAGEIADWKTLWNVIWGGLQWGIKGGG